MGRRVLFSSQLNNKRAGKSNPIGSLPYKKKSLRELDFLSLEKRRLRADLVTMFQYLQDGFKEDRIPFLKSCMERTKSNGYKFLLGKFQVNTREQFFTMRTISHRNNLPKGVVAFPMLDTFKIHLDRMLGNLI